MIYDDDDVRQCATPGCGEDAWPGSNLCRFCQGCDEQDERDMSGLDDDAWFEPSGSF